MLQEIEDKKIKKGRDFSSAGLEEINEMHAHLVANLHLAMSVFLNGNVRDAQRLLKEKARFRDLELAYAASHLNRLSDGKVKSIETSALHIDMISDLKRINSLLCSLAYPVLEAAGPDRATPERFVAGCRSAGAGSTPSGWASPPSFLPRWPALAQPGVSIRAMTAPLNLGTVALLTAAPLLWAGNAIVGRLIYELISPFTLNFIRWAAACVLLLPIAWRVLKKDGPLWPRWKSYAVLGFLGMGCHNSLLYCSLKTSSPLNVTLVSASICPFGCWGWAACFGAPPSMAARFWGRCSRFCGVVLVLTRGTSRCCATCNWCLATCSCCWPR